MTTHKHIVTLVETKRGRECCETTPRYDIYVNGINTMNQLYWNIRGYVGELPLFGGSKFTLGEAPISRWRKLAADINKGRVS